MGILAGADHAALEAYCRAYGRWVQAEKEIDEKGYIYTTVNGNEIINPTLSVANKALEQSSVKPFDITGRPMKGWVMVEEKGFKGGALDTWLDQAHEFAETLLPK